MKISTQVLTHVVHLWDGQQIAVTQQIVKDLLNSKINDKTIFKFRKISWRKSAVSKITEIKKIKRWQAPSDPVTTQEDREKTLALIKNIRKKYCE